MVSKSVQELESQVLRCITSLSFDEPLGISYPGVCSIDTDESSSELADARLLSGPR